MRTSASSAGHSPQGMSDALRAGDQQAFGRLLATSQVSVVTVDGPNGPRPKVVLDQDGRRVILAFTSPQTLGMWDEPISAFPADGPDLPGLATAVAAEIISFDSGGPARVDVGVTTLRELLEGIVEVAGSTKLVGNLHVRFDASMHQVFHSRRDQLDLGPDGEVYILTRETPTGAVVTLFTDDADVVTALRRTVPAIALPGQAVDIVATTGSIMAGLRRQYAMARV